MSSVEMKQLKKSFGATGAVRDVSVAVSPGEMFFLLGPSGCGKTTCLRLLAGFETPDAGDILFDGRSMVSVPPHRRGVGMVFQTYALFPHMTVRKNVEYGLGFSGVPAGERRRRAGDMLDVLRIGDLAGRYPSQLSGGQQQRVALARALVVRPEVLLLDEPLSNLDTKLRAEVREEIRRLHAEFRTTTVCVTHDQEEALSLADRLAVMRDGRVEQIGAPREIYGRPVSAFVATFVGESNLIPGRAAGAAGVETPHGPLRTEARVAEGKQTLFSVRPECVTTVAAEGAGPWSGTVAAAQFFGGSMRLEVKMANGDILIARSSGPEAPAPGTAVRVDIRPGDAVTLEG